METIDNELRLRLAELQKDVTTLADSVASAIVQLDREDLKTLTRTLATLHYPISHIGENSDALIRRLHEIGVDPD